MAHPRTSDLRPHWPGIALTSSSHMVNDLYQGIVPAMLPFLAAEREYSYALLAGLTLAATLISSVAQPVFGVIGDRRPLRWMIPAGMGLAAIGLAVVGFTDSYALTWMFVALSGLGIAAFHPEASRAAREASGNSNQAMSLFALGGNTGYALGAVVATPVFLAFGVRGAPLLLIPAVVMIAIVLGWMPRLRERAASVRSQGALAAGPDDWTSFAYLILVIILRSTIFLAMTSFLGLFFIRHLDASEAVAGAALTVFLVAGAVGTLFGGWLADRTNRIVSIRAGFVLALPALGGLLLSPNIPLALVASVVLAVALYLPFSVIIMLGQDYLPGRIGTASGVTVGLPMTIGGLFAPLVGTLADHTSLTVALSTLLVLPVLALVITTRLHDPAVAA